MGGNRDRTCLGGCERRNESNARVTGADELAEGLFKLPTRGLTLEIFFPQPEHDSGPNGEDWFLHGEDVSFHRRHIELVLSLIGWKKFSAGGDISDFCDALDDHGFLRMLGADHAVRILRQVARFARLAASAEQQATVLPQAPHDHGMRRTIRLDGRNPVVV